MVDNDILDLYSERRNLLYQLSDEIKEHTDLSNLDKVTMDTYSIINKMKYITEAINSKCNDDFTLIDLYRRLSLSLSKEEYEKAALIKNEINSYKFC